MWLGSVEGITEASLSPACRETVSNLARSGLLQFIDLLWTSPTGSHSHRLTQLSVKAVPSITGVTYSWETNSYSCSAQQKISRCHWNSRLPTKLDFEYSNFTYAIYDYTIITDVIALGRWLFNGLLNMLVDVCSFCQRSLRQSRHYGMSLVVIQNMSLSFMMI